MRLFHRRTAVVIHDLFMAGLAWQAAYLLRANFSFPEHIWDTAFQVMPEVLVIQALVFWFTGLYRGLWRFASLPDLVNILKAAVFGTLLIALVLFIHLRLVGIPRSVLVMYPVLLILLLGGPRLGYRLWKDHSLNLKDMAGGRRDVLIVGAGNAGEQLGRDILRESRYRLLGFLDDNPALRGSRLHGLPVFGGMEKLPRLVERYDLDLIIIAIPSATDEQMQRIVTYCEQTGCAIRTLPRLQDMLSSRPSVRDLRDLSIEDLLGRKPVKLDWELIRGGLAGKRVLVTGGGGSIGSELCRQIANLSPASLIILERGEFNLFTIRRQLERDHANINFHAVLGDICDRDSLETVFEQHLPDVILHAAAYKQVPLLEEHEREAVNNNVIGTMNVAEMADRYGSEKFILISTDKAVNPVNVLGISKRIAELYCENKSRNSQTRFITVRFGNVLGSNGSVIPVFREQIEAGGPVTVTHREMERYFMTVQEACLLILQAGAMGRGGEIFVLDMGKPVRIAYLAEQMILLAGRKPGEDVEIRYIGLRPGEKLSEDLFYWDETIDQTAHPKIQLARHTAINWDIFEQALGRLLGASRGNNHKELHAALQRILIETGDRSTEPAGGRSSDSVLPFQKNR